MTSRTRHSLRIASLAMAGVTALGVAPAVNVALSAGLKTVAAEATLLDTQSWIMGGSGLPIPPPSYLEAVSERFIDPTAYPDFSGGKPLFPGQPLFPVDGTNALFTPEGLYPLTGVKTLELDPSLSQGVQILNNAITEQIAAGNNATVLGYSQSAIINSLEMRNLLALPPDQQPTAEQLAFILLGDVSNANGGLLSRFDLPGMQPLTLPSVGITFSGPTPADTPWDTAIYTREYDGFADFPKYPMNFLSDLNAFLGIMFVHGHYPQLTPEQMATAIELPVSDDYTGHTQYFMIPTETLPLVQLLQAIPLIGKPLGELLGPDLRILVNLGYGNIEHGWDLGPANVHTPFSAFPDINTGDLMSALAKGTQEGFNALVGGSGDLSLPSMTDQVSSLASGGLPSLTDIVNAFTNATASAYSALLPTADILNAQLISFPTYAASVFMHELTSGNLLDAIGLPPAAMVGLTTMAVGIEVEVLMNTVSDIEAAFKDLIPS